MAKTRRNNIISKDDKFKQIKDIIEYYDDGTHNKTDDKWYGQTFDHLMSHSPIRLKNIHIHLMKKKKNAESTEKG